MTSSQSWLAENLLPLGRVEVGWDPDEPTELDDHLIELGLQVADPIGGQPRWCGERVAARGAAALFYGDEHVIEGLAGRLIVLDPARHERTVSRANDTLFEYDADGRYRLSQAGIELERLMLSIKHLSWLPWS